MQTDGSIDYSGYTLPQLREALSLIDKKKYPTNFRHLQAEIVSRPEPDPMTDASSYAESIESTEVAPEPDSPWRRYRTFWRRLVAGLLDGLVLWPLSWMSESIRTDAWSAFPLVAWNACLYLAGIVYSVYFISRHGATIGKMLAGVRVMDLSEKRRPSPWQAILREIVPVVINCAALAYLVLLVLAGRYEGRESYFEQLSVPIGVLALAWFILEFVTMFTNPKRRALHDFIARTVVVRHV